MTETKTLKQYEAAIERAESSFIAKGEALAGIRDTALFEQASGTDEAWTFERYCAERWEYDRSYAYRLINGARVAKVAKQIGFTLNEGQARELADLHNDPDELGEILGMAKEAAGDGRITAKLINAKRRERAKLLAPPPAERPEGDAPQAPEDKPQHDVDPDAGENWPQVLRRVKRLVNGYVGDVPQEYQASLAQILERAAVKSRNRAQRG